MEVADNFGPMTKMSSSEVQFKEVRESCTKEEGKNDACLDGSSSSMTKGSSKGANGERY